MLALQTLTARLAEFDGKAMTILGEIEAQLGGEPQFLRLCAALCNHDDANVSAGASWLLKSALDNGGVLGAEVVAEMLEHLPGEHSWGAQLHVCQLIGRLALSDGQAHVLAAWLGPLLAHKRPFIRAWSLDALVMLSRSHADLADSANRALAAAEDDLAASVRARARNLVK